MRLIDLPRTSGFRMALVFLALFGLASTILLGFLYLHTQHFLIARVDDWLHREAPAIFRTPADRLAERIDDRAARNAASENVFMLLDADGTRLAGFARAATIAVGILDRPTDLLLQPGGTGIRGIAHRLPDGRVIVVGQNREELDEFRASFVQMAASGAALTIVLGLLGASFVGVVTVRRFDKVTTAIERIVRGDLSRRLPVDGSSSDLNRLASVVNAMLADIERLMHEVKGVCDGIAHDLRTPLTRLLAGLERARRRAGDDPLLTGAHTGAHTEALDEAIERVGSILQTFTSLLRIAEVEDGARRAGFVAVALLDIATDVIDFYDPLAEAKGVSLALRCPNRALGTVPGDPSLLFEAIGNLVDNAIKYAPSGGHVTVEVLNDGSHLVLGVRDDGPGIQAIDREAVLRRFYRTEASRSTHGNGLGLSLVAAVARLHNFTLAIGDAGPGCRVTLRLPLGPPT